MTGQAICPYLERRGNRFVCKKTRKAVYPGLERCLLDYSECEKFRGERK